MAGARVAILKRLHSSTVQVGQDSSNPQPLKRLRLTAKPGLGSTVSITAYANLIENCTTSNEVLQILIHISDALQFDNGDMSEVVRKFSEHFRRETESAVRVKILALLSEFANETNIEPTALVDECLLLLQPETSPKVLSQGLQSFLKIEQTHSLPTTHILKVVAASKRLLTFASHNVQRHALLVLGAFSPLIDAEQETLDLIGCYTDSQDSRVRAQAFRSILILGERGVPLAVALYPRAISALHDDYECVRKEALQLVYGIGVKHPDHLISLPDSEVEMRIIDDAFGKICSALCDLSMQVRTQAAELLGGMTAVSVEFLHQTLDKKLMSNLRRKKSLHERSLEHFTSGEWSSGKKWADDAPKEAIKSNSISLMASGACGALVHGLEDEFLEVRTASVDSMCRLALTNNQFAVTSLDFLVDMFNDEIEGVRLRAIYSLTAISKHIVLREDQLEIMLSSLEDYSVEVREGLHVMLGACKVATQACLMLVLQKVLDVLAKYPQDKYSAFGCLQRVGQRHPELCMSLTPQLLHDHPFFDSAEQDVEDPAYICILILLFNGAQHMPPMLTLFPEAIIRHYAYLRDTMPNLVPHLALGDTSRQLSLDGQTGSQPFLETLLHNIETTCSAPHARQALLEAAQDNLGRLAAIDPSLSGTANFTAAFLGAQLIIERLQSNVNTSRNRVPPREYLNQLMKKCLRLQNLFSGLTLHDQLLVIQICLRASATHLVLIVKDRTQSALAPCQFLLRVASEASIFIQENANELSPDEFTKTLLEQLANLVDPKPGRVYREILPIVETAAPVATPQINLNIKMCTATILDPSDSSESSENVVKVTAGLIAAVPLTADIFSLRECQRQDLRLRIKYPDQNVHLVVPRQRDLRRIANEEANSNNWRLRTTVLLSHTVWTESSQIEISICLAVQPNNELELCKSVKVLFAPKPVKRGI